MSAELSALADLLLAGRTHEEALTAMMGAGGQPARWARRIAGAAKSGGLGVALAQNDVLTRRERALLGSADAASHGGTLRWIVERRAHAKTQVAVCIRALTMPALWAILTVAASLPMALLGGPNTVGLGSLMPLVVLVVLVFAGRWGWPSALARSTGVERLLPGYLEGRFAAFMAAGLRDGQDVDTAARRAARVAPSINVGPPVRAPGVSDALALCVVTGTAAGDLADRLDRFADERAIRVTRGLVMIVRLAAWGVVFWVSWRVMGAMMDVSLGSLQGIEGLDLGGGQSGDLEELMRELDL